MTTRTTWRDWHALYQDWPPEKVNTIDEAFDEMRATLAAGGFKTPRDDDAERIVGEIVRYAMVIETADALTEDEVSAATTYRTRFGHWPEAISDRAARVIQRRARKRPDVSPAADSAD